MASIPADKHGSGSVANLPPHETYRHAEHFRNAADEFDAAKMGVWLFLATEVLLFSGLFVFYGVMRMLHPEAFIHGSSLLDWRWGLFNTIVLLLSSFTVADAVRCAQSGDQKGLRRNIVLTFILGTAFLLIKFVFEYAPKYAEGKLPGAFFSYPNWESPYEPLWWGLYWGATGIHASHVVVGMGLFIWLYIRAKKGHFGPKHYTAVEGVGLYWHIVDIVWIFLFPMLYLIH